MSSPASRSSWPKALCRSEYGRAGRLLARSRRGVNFACKGAHTPRGKRSDADKPIGAYRASLRSASAGGLRAQFPHPSDAAGPPRNRSSADSQSVPTGRPLPFLRHPSRAFRPMSSLLSYHYRPSTAASRLGRLGARQAWIANRGLPGVPLPSPLSALGTHFDASVAFILDRPA